MSVIVKNMEMPKNCKECKMWSICECLNDFEDFESICYAVEDGDLVRDKNCPLIELPPHGRLIDVDKIEYEKLYIDDVGKSYEMVGKDDIDELPTVIEAEGSET